MPLKKLSEAHFSGLPSQSNIYGMTTLNMGEGSNKVLVSSLERNVFCIEYTRNAQNLLIPSSREVQFTYLPGGADIIAVDSFTRSTEDSLDVIVGIAFIRPGESQTTQYLNIYSDWEPGGGLDLDKIAQGCLSLELDFIPYHLTHAFIFPETLNSQPGEMVWLLSGSDCSVHLFKEDKSHQSYSKVPIESYFPEFSSIPSIVLVMDVMYMKNGKSRVSAAGCENGCLHISVTELQDSEIKIVRSWTIDLDTPLSLVKLFTDTVNYQLPKCLENNDMFSEKTREVVEDEVHILVGNTLDTSFVYRNVLQEGINKFIYLPDSDQFDTITCGCIADIDMDGRNEIILGTYGQEILVYKQNISEKKEKYKLEWQQSLSHPVLCLRYLDLTGDGVCELLALSTRGLHILQHDLQDISDLCQQRIKKLIDYCSTGS